MESFDDIITVVYLWRHLLFLVTFSRKIRTSSILLKFSIERLITKLSWDWQLTMISAEKLQFPADLSEKFNKHSSIIKLPWQQWVFHETNLYLKWKLINLY